MEPYSQSLKFKLGSSWDETREKLKETDYRINDNMFDFPDGQEYLLIERLRPLFLDQSDENIVKWVESVSCNTAKAG